MNQLQKSLRYNVIFSALCGIACIAYSKYLANLFNTSNATFFLILGIGLLLFTASLIFEIKRQKPLGVLFIIFQDFLWVIGSIVLLLLQPFDISKIGNEIIAGVALVVLLIGISQSKALAQVDDSNKKDGIKLFRFERIVNASKKKAWDLISDVENYHEVANNIDHVKIISGEGNGMVRSCSHKKDSWTETCTTWNEGNDYVFKVDTEAEDYPYPFSYLQGHWKVEEVNHSQSKIIMNFEFKYNRKFQNWLIHPLLKSKFEKTAEELLDNWQKKLENK